MPRGVKISTTLTAPWLAELTTGAFICVSSTPRSLDDERSHAKIRLMAPTLGRLFVRRQQEAGDGAPAVEPLAPRSDDVVRGHRLDERRPVLDILDRLAGGQGRAIPARQHRLVVLSVDRIGDEARLGALERPGVNALGEKGLENAVD